MARPSRIQELAKLLRDEKALQEIGSSIVRDALVQAARVAGANPKNLDDPPWDDAWADAGDNWSNHWGDSGDPHPNWSDHNNGWTNVWTQGYGDMRIIAERVPAIYSKELKVEEKKILVQLKLLAK